MIKVTNGMRTSYLLAFIKLHNGCFHLLTHVTHYLLHFTFVCFLTKKIIIPKQIARTTDQKIREERGETREGEREREAQRTEFNRIRPVICATFTHFCHRETERVKMENDFKTLKYSYNLIYYYHFIMLLANLLGVLKTANHWN